MPRVAYVARAFSAGSRKLIQRANEIIAAYDAQGFRLTLRQLYYQFVSRDLIANRQSEYKRLGSVINDARLAGLIDWLAIEDRTRWVRLSDHDSGNPDTWLQRVADSFSKARWATQSVMPEVWIEKDALVGVIQGVCNELFVPFFACRGYTSQSEVWSASQRLIDYYKADQTPLILHLGDHDPSGLDMTRDIDDRLRLFCEHHGYQAPIVKRLALNWDQVQQYAPPPNPAKLTDSRIEGYMKRFGSESWELDALEPTVIAALIRDEIEAVIDRDAWSEAEAEEQAGIARLKLVAGHFAEVVAQLEQGGQNGHA